MCWLIVKYAASHRFVSLPRLVSLFDPAGTDGVERDPGRLVRLVDALMRRTYGEEYCTKRSLILFHFLRKANAPVQIRFGVAKKDNKLRGHAWIEIDEAPFAEHNPPEDNYNVVYTFPAQTASGEPAGPPPKT